MQFCFKIAALIMDIEPFSGPTTFTNMEQVVWGKVCHVLTCSLTLI
jgi:hypothetical protein